MSEEQAVQAALAAKFPGIEQAIRIQRVRRIFATAPRGELEAILNYAVKEQGFCILCAITGVDDGATLGVIYHLARESGVMLNVKTSLPKEAPLLPTITHFFPAADAYERELADLLGIQVQGLPEGTRYPLPDDWPAGQFPLRKDWQPDSLQAAPSRKEAQDA